MANSLAVQKQISIGGQEYTMQMISAEAYLDIMDTCKNEDGNLITGKYIKSLCTAVVVHFDISQFDGKIRALRKLNTEVEKFIMGEEVEVDEKNESEPESNESEISGFSGDQLLKES